MGIKKNKIVLLGDTHGVDYVIDEVYREYISTGQAERIIHLGDLGFVNSWKRLVRKYSPEEIQVIAGNHDEYNWIAQNNPPHYLGDFGLVPGTEDVFFIRGAWSIDQRFRKVNVSWWEAEELDLSQRQECTELYLKIKPRVILSHDCPQFIINSLHPNSAFLTNTSQLLEHLHDLHEPEEWYFGHHHLPFTCNKGNTTFRCLNINETLLVKV